MKTIKNFTAFKVYEYLDMDIDFFPELTFLYGLNGTGKTTALKLIMALLTPSIKTLISIPFETIRVNGISQKSNDVMIECKRKDDIITLSSNLTKNILEINICGIDMEDIEDSIEKKFRNHDVIESINKLTTPMFLGIDRRFVISPRMPRNVKRHYITYKQMQLFSDYEENYIHGETIDFDPGLLEVKSIIDRFVRNLKIKQENLDNYFRKQLLLESFSYVEPESQGLSNLFSAPSEPMIQNFRSKQKTILSTLKGLGLLSEEFEKKSEHFLSSIEKVIDEIQKSDFPKPKGKKFEMTDKLANALSAWFVNQPQVDRINRLLNLVNEYQEKKEAIYKQLDAFVDLSNKFFKQIGKELSVDRQGSAKFSVGNRIASINALSSGERQIFIMLAHLFLNTKLLKDGIFIVDEPELSLHMDWQDMFVEATKSANPKLQVVLSTHSPAIIGGRNNLCVPVIKL